MQGSGLYNREVQRSDQVSDVSQQAEVMPDLAINDLIYKRPLALSLATQRTYNRQFFQRTAYGPGETAVIDFNSGTDFVDPLNSYITFTVDITGAGTAGFGVGSAMNLIKQVTLRSRSGMEVDRVEHANIWSLYNTAYSTSPAYLSGPGQLEGFGVNSDRSLVGAGVTGLTAGAPVRYAIPLKRLAPFFNPVNGHMKVPPQLMSGLHMEIIWEDASVALFATAATVTAYAITNLAMMTDSICMTDDLQRTINEQSANAGLEYTYPRVFWQSEVANSTTALNAQIRKAVTLGEIAWAVPLLTPAVAATEVVRDSFAALVWDVTQFQFRLGALYFPLQPLSQATPGLLSTEAYFTALETFDRIRNPANEPFVSKTNFAQAAGFGILSASMEKDQTLSASGLPLNNSRVLEINAVHGAVANRIWHMFLEYMSVARSYIDNTNVAI